MSTSPFSFSIMAKPAGSRCNQHCDYCFYRDKGKIFPSSASASAMSSEVLQAFVEQFINSQPPGEPVRFIWQGGEPSLCGLDFFGEVVELQKRFAQGRRIENALQTNGSLIDEEWGKFFKENHFLIGLSLDGPENLHNHYRHYEEPGAHARALAALECLKDCGVDFNVLVTVNRQNQLFPERIYDFIVGLGVKFLQFIPIVERSLKNGKTLLSPPFATAENQPTLPGGERLDSEAVMMAPWSVTPREYGQFLRRLFFHWVQRNDVGRISVQIFEALAAYCLGLPAPVCVFAERCAQTPVLEKNGDLFCCDHYVEKGFYLGNILEKPLLEMVNSQRLEEFALSKMYLPPQCKSCPIIGFCQGDCPKHRVSLSSTEAPGSAVSYLCKSYRYFFQHAEPVLREILSNQP